ncbi:unnamed protein product [Rotaria socialis]
MKKQFTRSQNLFLLETMKQKKSFLILLYKNRAECYYAVNDINKTIEEGFVCARDDKMFYMLNIWLYFSVYDTVIYDRNTEPCMTVKYDRIREQTERMRPFTIVYGLRKPRPEQIKLRSCMDFYRVIRMLNNLKLGNIFVYRDIWSDLEKLLF